jgi:hypothetical protein
MLYVCSLFGYIYVCAVVRFSDLLTIYNNAHKKKLFHKVRGATILQFSLPPTDTRHLALNAHLLPV